jgi:hypothetical protein
VAAASPQIITVADSILLSLSYGHERNAAATTQIVSNVVHPAGHLAHGAAMPTNPARLNIQQAQAHPRTCDFSQDDL